MSDRGDLLVRNPDHPRGLGARNGGVAAPRERSPHLDAVLDEPFADTAAHHAGCDNCDDRLHGCLLQLAAV